MVDWDVEFMFRAAGGLKGMAELCAESAANPPPPRTLAVWKCRKCIPSDWLAIIAHGLIARGVSPVDLFRNTFRTQRGRITR